MTLNNLQEFLREQLETSAKQVEDSKVLQYRAEGAALLAQHLLEILASPSSMEPKDG